MRATPGRLVPRISLEAQHATHGPEVESRPKGDAESDQGGSWEAQRGALSFIGWLGAASLRGRL